MIPIVGTGLDQRWNEWLSRLDDGSRGPITSLLDAVSGFIPSYAYAEPWTKVLEKHPVESTLIVAAIVASLRGSNILQWRIHDRARLAWHKNLQQDYAEWLKRRMQAQKGWRNGVLLALAIAVVGLVLSFLFGAGGQIKLELEVGILVVAPFALLALSYFGKRQDSDGEKGSIRSTFPLSVARVLRSNSLLRAVYHWVFERAVPIAFALLIVAAGGFIFNRALFDGVSAAGSFCKGTLDAKAPNTEKTGTKEGFTTDQMCWPTGLALEEGRRYRITLATPGDWFDRTILQVRLCKGSDRPLATLQLSRRRNGAPPSGRIRSFSIPIRRAASS